MSCRQEFKLRNVTLYHSRDDLFYLSHWNLPPAIFTAYRFIVSLYTLVWFGYSSIWYEGTELATLHNFMCYLTNWSFVTLVAHLLVAFVICCLSNVIEGRSCFLRPNNNPSFRARDEYTLVPGSDVENTESHTDNDHSGSEDAASDSTVKIQTPNSIPWYFKLSWALFSISSSAAILVTVVYFAFLYPMIAKQTGETGPSLVDFVLHGTNSIIVLLELTLAAYPVRILHIVYPLIYGLAYVVFSLIYWSFDHEKNVLYPEILDWNMPGQTMGVVLIIALIFLPVLQVLFYGIYRLKIYLYSKIFNV